MDEYDEKRMEEVHQENIRKAKEAAATSSSSSVTEPTSQIASSTSVQSTSDRIAKKITDGFGITRDGPPRKVSDEEISEYQGWSGSKAKQKKQSRKRTQARRDEPYFVKLTMALVIGGIGLMLFVAIISSF